MLSPHFLRPAGTGSGQIAMGSNPLITGRDDRAGFSPSAVARDRFFMIDLFTGYDRAPADNCSTSE
jgi:hypothetical protein